MLNTLVGRSIVAVTYHEIDYGDGEPMWNRESESFDSLDFGLTLRLDDDSVVSVTWGHELTNHNIWLQHGALELGSSARTWDATSRWNALVGDPIVEANLVWAECLPGERHREYPQSLVLRFQSARSVVISAFESRGGDSMGMMDHVTVFFDEAEAARLRLL